jgi:hypothetical protein
MGKTVDEKLQIRCFFWRVFLEVKVGNNGTFRTQVSIFSRSNSGRISESGGLLSPNY